MGMDSLDTSCQSSGTPSPQNAERAALTGAAQCGQEDAKPGATTNGASSGSGGAVASRAAGAAEQDAKPGATTNCAPSGSAPSGSGRAVASRAAGAAELKNSYDGAYNRDGKRHGERIRLGLRATMAYGPRAIVACTPTTMEVRMRRMLERQHPSPPLVRARSASGFTWEAMAAGKLSERFQKLLEAYLVRSAHAGCALRCVCPGRCYPCTLAHSSVPHEAVTYRSVLVRTKHILQHPPASSVVPSALAATTASGRTACVTATVYSSCPTAAATKARACARLRVTDWPNKPALRSCRGSAARAGVRALVRMDLAVRAYVSVQTCAFLRACV